MMFLCLQRYAKNTFGMYLHKEMYEIGCWVYETPCLMYEFFRQSVVSAGNCRCLFGRTVGKEVENCIICDSGGILSEKDVILQFHCNYETIYVC